METLFVVRVAIKRDEQGSGRGRGKGEVSLREGEVGRYAHTKRAQCPEPSRNWQCRLCNDCGARTFLAEAMGNLEPSLPPSLTHSVSHSTHDNLSINCIVPGKGSLREMEDTSIYRKIRQTATCKIMNGTNVAYGRISTRGPDLSLTPIVDAAQTNCMVGCSLYQPTPLRSVFSLSPSAGDIDNYSDPREGRRDGERERPIIRYMDPPPNARHSRKSFFAK